jgi:hypothetical protein
MKSRCAFLCLSMITAIGCSASTGGDKNVALANVKADIQARTTLYAADLDATSQAAESALNILERGVVKLQQAKAAAAGEESENSVRLKTIEEQLAVRNEKVAKLKELQAKLSMKKSGLEQFIRADLAPDGKTAENGGSNGGTPSAATLKEDYARAEEGARHLTVEILGAVVEAHNLDAPMN